jgi:hypothetical protein
MGLPVRLQPLGLMVKQYATDVSRDAGPIKPKERVGGYGLDSSCLEYVPVVGSCEQGNELSRPIKYEEYD